MEKEQQRHLPHSIILEDRKTLRISGVKDVDGFNDARVLLDTVLGALIIKGEDLRVISLDSDTGDLLMKGAVTSIAYTRRPLPDTPVRRLFR